MYHKYPQILEKFWVDESWICKRCFRGGYAKPIRKSGFLNFVGCLYSKNLQVGRTKIMKYISRKRIRMSPKEVFPNDATRNCMVKPFIFTMNKSPIAYFSFFLLRYPNPPWKIWQHETQSQFDCFMCNKLPAKSLLQVHRSIWWKPAGGIRSKRLR